MFPFKVGDRVLVLPPKHGHDGYSGHWWIVSTHTSDDNCGLVRKPEITHPGDVEIFIHVSRLRAA